ncbi:MAG: ABC transporter ATP-binding protein, partial [Eubacteriales bacterium]|nr:ABC transporter ATP-binding protein [Eubacteriales bacterium]
MEIRAENISVAYGEYLAVESMNLRPPEGEITSIIGPNGSGKSTVLKAMTQILPVKGGKVYLDQKEIHSIPAKQIAKTIATLSQVHDAPADFTVRELISYGRLPYKKFFERLNSEDDEI